jgi:hypothetical protein
MRVSKDSLVVSIVLCYGGLVWLGYLTDWRVALAVFLIIGGNNIAQEI